MFYAIFQDKKRKRMAKNITATFTIIEYYYYCYYYIKKLEFEVLKGFKTTFMW